MEYDAVRICIQVPTFYEGVIVASSFGVHQCNEMFTEIVRMDGRQKWPKSHSAAECDAIHPMKQQPLVAQGLLVIEASRSHSDTPHSVGPLWTNDQPDAETST